MSSPPPALFELLPLHAMGVLDEDEATEVERALTAHPALRVELIRWHEAIAALGSAPVPAAPALDVRARLLASLDGRDGPGDATDARPGGRLERFATQVADLFDVSVDSARAVLARVDDSAAWRPMMPGIDCLRVSAGPRWKDAQCNLVRIAPGTRFPWHHHAGEEASLVLHGGAHMSDGRDLEPGDLLVVDESVEHDFIVESGGEACIFAVRAHGIVPGKKL